MKLVILGGGGFRVPNVHQALLAQDGPLRRTEVVLYDTSAQRLEVMQQVLARQAERAAGGPAPQVSATTSLDGALAGASFVFSAIRVGGLDGRVADERVALRLGVLGQETTGPGGIAFALRTIPVAVAIAGRIREICPDAFVINFTNPAGMITEAMQAVLGERVVGICDTPGGLGRRIAVALGLDPGRVRLDYVGLNHLGWMRRVLSDGEDVLPRLLADDEALARLEETEIFGAPWLRTLGCIPNEYLYYYYFNTDAVASILSQPATRGEFLARQQAAFYAAAAAQPQRALELWQQASAERRALYMAEAKAKPGLHDGWPSAGQQPDGQQAGDPPEAGSSEATAEPPGEGGYSGVALAVMNAIAANQPATMILNVRNGGALAGIDADAVVELPAMVDSSGARPLATSPPDDHQAGLVRQVKAVERATIEAATTGSDEAALRAFALHPLVGSVSVARELLAGYRIAQDRR
ncbi:MAG: 6-phospho-beta-glucosidase [Streptosporangiaceae bacterium]